MRKVLPAVLVAASLALSPAARAAEMKIAVIDSNALMNENDEGKALISTINAEFTQKKSMLDGKQKEFEALRDEFEKQAALLNDQAKKDKQADLQKRYEELQQLVQATQQEFDARMGEAQKAVGQKVRLVVKEVAEADGVEVVLDKQATVWVKDALDITNEVIRKYNVKFPYKGGGAVAPAAAGTKPTAKPASAKAKPQ